MLSQTVEYALRAVVYLASDAATPQTNTRIARATKVPAPYLSKVMQALHRGGVVVALRGLHGGFRLVKSPAELTILEVVNAVEPIGRIEVCPLGIKSHGANLCPLHKRLDDSLAAMEEAFRRTTLAELLAEPTTSVPLCEFPLAAPREKKTPAARGKSTKKKARGTS